MAVRRRLLEYALILLLWVLVDQSTAHHHLCCSLCVIMTIVRTALIWIASGVVLVHGVLLLDLLIVGGADRSAVVNRMRLRAVEAALIDTTALRARWHAIVNFVYVIYLVYLIHLLGLHGIATVPNAILIMWEVRGVRSVDHCVVD